MEIINLFGRVNYIITSRGGLGKSRLFKETIKDDYLILSSHLTPLALHMELYNYAKERDFKGINVLLDDIDNAESNSLLVSLLKRCGESEKIITMHYHSTRLLKMNVPETYDIENIHIAIMGNSFKTLNNNKMNIEALLDRVIQVEFIPSNLDIFKYLESWAENSKVLSLLKKYYLHSSNFSLRSYIKGCALQKYVKDWEEIMKKDLCIDEVEYVLNSNLPNNKKVLEISKLRKCGIRNAQIILKKRRKEK